MRIVQSTWVRYHHFDLARELQSLGHLERIFTSLPWWKADLEAKEQGIPRHKISCNFFMQGIRHVGAKLPFYSSGLDAELAVRQTKIFSQWVANQLPECEAYFGISGSGLPAGKKAKQQGSGYIMDRGSTQIRYADAILREEHARWKLPWEGVHPWLMSNEEAEAEEAHLITVPSHFVANSFVSQGVCPKKLRVIPYGVSLKEFYPVGTPALNVFRIVFVGQFSLRKGIPYLLQAFKAFQHPNKELLIVGAVAKELHPLISSLMDNRVKFVGPVSRAEVKNYLSTSHALVLPSIEEGLALVQAQAMACGCPVIATPNTGSETLFSHGREGLIVEARHAESLTAAFTRLADEPALRTAMSAACLERVRQLGGWKSYAQGMLLVAEEARKLAVDFSTPQ